MTGFYVREWIEKRDGVVISQRTMTVCSECGGELKSCEDWSHHKKIHTRITNMDRACWIPKEA